MSSKIITPVGFIRSDFNEKFGIPRQSGRINNLAEIVFNPPYNDEVTDEATVYLNDPVLEIKKKADKETVKVGDTIKYTVTVKQTVSDMEATAVVITDKIEEGIEINLDSVKVNGEIKEDKKIFLNDDGKIYDVEVYM